MKAWLLPAPTGIESMTLADVPDPSPAPGELLLQVQFAALNPADRYLSMGQYPAKPTFPHTLGRDGVGTVLAVGSNVTGINVGDTRLILRGETGVSRPGTLAEKVAVDAHYTVRVPAGWSLEQAAAAPLVYVTAWQALTQWGELKATAPEGNTAAPVILITGASGGVGVASIQLAHAMGCTIVALSRSEEKSKALRGLGADFTFNPADPQWRNHVKAALGTRRVDLAIDNIGGDAFNHLLEVMAPFGRISVVGRLAGPVPNFNTSALLFRRLKIGGVAIATYTLEESRAAWNAVLATLAKTNAKPLIDHIFPLAEVPAAFARLAEGPLGKVLIRVGNQA